MTLNAFDKTNFNALIPNLEAGQKADPEKLQNYLTDVESYLEAIRNALISVASGDSGADLVKATALNAQSGTSVQAILAYLLAQIQGITQGAVADGSVSEPKLAVAVATKLNQIASATAIGHIMVGSNLSIDANGVLSATGNARIATGTYTGDGTATRTINVGVTPKFLFVSALNKSGTAAQVAITGYDATAGGLFEPSSTGSAVYGEGPADTDVVTIAANGFVIHTPNTSVGLNLSAVPYGWTAIY